MTCIYNSFDRDVMYRTAKSQNKSRLVELIEFAKISGFKKLGIAGCSSVARYSDKLSEILTEAGFEVCLIKCKESGLDAAEICDSLSGPSCDPLSQAEYLNSQNTDFNIMVGLCLGHELIFQKYSKVPYTTFMVKDFSTKNRTAAVLE